MSTCFLSTCTALLLEAVLMRLPETFFRQRGRLWGCIQTLHLLRSSSEANSQDWRASTPRFMLIDQQCAVRALVQPLLWYCRCTLQPSWSNQSGHALCSGH